MSVKKSVLEQKTNTELGKMMRNSKNYHDNIYEPAFVKKMFNRMSSSYERMNYITSFGFSIRWRRQFLEKLGKSNQHLNVIDLLSGLGENWTFLKRNFPNATFYALDFSDKMISHSNDICSLHC